MKRIDGLDRAVDLFGAGKDGFKTQVPGVSLATQQTAKFLNGVQEAIVRTIELAGFALSEADYDQFTNAIQYIADSRLISAIVYFPTASPPSGWLRANGAAISRTVYANLFARIGTTYGIGDGSTTFGLPDLRGEFLRGWDDARGIDAARALGTAQAGQNESHIHGVNDPPHNHVLNETPHSHVLDVGNVQVSGVAAGAGYGAANPTNKSTNAVATGITMNAAATGVSIVAAGGNESRPRNIAMLACIKF